jgi:hypothetical protein
LSFRILKITNFDERHRKREQMHSRTKVSHWRLLIGGNIFEIKKVLLTFMRNLWIEISPVINFDNHQKVSIQEKWNCVLVNLKLNYKEYNRMLKLYLLKSENHL